MKAILATFATMLLAAAAIAQQPAPEGASLGEIMPLQQLRHIKLWFAGSVGNWRLAAYELSQLDDGFGDVNKLLGGSVVENTVGDPIRQLRKVLDEKNAAAFPAAFDALSGGCNICHGMLDHAFIVIQRPALLPYSDQSFAPQK